MFSLKLKKDQDNKREVRKVSEIEKQVKKVLEGTDQKLILMVKN